jgi:hypothetical protein
MVLPLAVAFRHIQVLPTLCLYLLLAVYQGSDEEGSWYCVKVAARKGKGDGMFGTNSNMTPCGHWDTSRHRRMGTTFS